MFRFRDDSLQKNKKCEKNILMRGKKRLLQADGDDFHRPFSKNNLRT